MNKHSYYIIYKPFNVLSQFSNDGDKKTLKDFFKVEKDVYPIGRLDYDSEGLLILTNDKSLNQILLNPKNNCNKNYLVQVEGVVSNESLQNIMNGIEINVDGTLYKTKKCIASVLSVEPNVHERFPPIRVRKNIPTSWLSITITEGKNRQVRKMTAAINHPTLRLIRLSIESVSIDKMKPGDMIKLSKNSLYKKLNLII